MLNHAKVKHLSGAGCDVNSTVNHSQFGLPCCSHHRKPTCVMFEQYIHDTFLLFVAVTAQCCLYVISNQNKFVHSAGRSFIEQNGWFLVGAGVLFYCLWIKMQPYIKKFREHQEERRYAAFCHKS